MLQQLKFVAGAVAKKDFLPAMTHFAIQNGVARSFNGTIAICSPIPIDINCYPKALTLVRAIAQCKETATMAMTPAGRLSIKSGNFKALIDCVEDSAVHVHPEGELLGVNGQLLLDTFKILEPFVGDDASRSWSNGILLSGMSAYATCNVVLAERYMGAVFPRDVVIPLAAIREVIRVGEAPTHAQADDKSFTFHYSDGRWIRTQLLDHTAWPRVADILNKPDAKLATAIDERIFDAIETVKPFADKEGRVFFKEGSATTHQQDDENGATVELPGSSMKGVYAIEMLQMLKGVATHANFDLYPAPCPFYGGLVRGVIIGRKA